MTEWFEDESFWEAAYPFLFREEAFERAGRQVDKILELVDFHGSTVLDLACGPGRHAIALAAKGFRVTGVDRTPFLLGKARERAAASKVDVDWVQKDMRNFVRPESFDLAINMLTSFGYFDDRSDNLKVLQNIHQSLHSGGLCLLEMASKEWLAKNFQPTGASELDDGTLLIQRREIFDDWSRIRNEWILIEGDSMRRFKFHHTIYSGREIKELLLEAAFSKVQLYGNLDGDDYGVDARRLVAVAARDE